MRKQGLTDRPSGTLVASTEAPATSKQIKVGVEGNQPPHFLALGTS